MRNLFSTLGTSLCGEHRFVFVAPGPLPAPEGTAEAPTARPSGAPTTPPISPEDRAKQKVGSALKKLDLRENIATLKAKVKFSVDSLKKAGVTDQKIEEVFAHPNSTQTFAEKAANFQRDIVNTLGAVSSASLIQGQYGININKLVDKTIGPITLKAYSLAVQNGMPNVLDMKITALPPLKKQTPEELVASQLRVLTADLNESGLKKGAVIRITGESKFGEGTVMAQSIDGSTFPVSIYKFKDYTGGNTDRAVALFLGLDAKKTGTDTAVAKAPSASEGKIVDVAPSTIDTGRFVMATDDFPLLPIKKGDYLYILDPGSATTQMSLLKRDGTPILTSPDLLGKGLYKMNESEFAAHKDTIEPTDFAQILESRDRQRVATRAEHGDSSST